MNLIAEVGKLEANPCGQWDWIEHATGLPLAQAIADELQGAS
ncbi:hypothetical protein [Streptomyces sp. NPDC007083]